MPISYIVDSSFHPYSFEERLKPYLLYKDAYEKTEAAYEDLATKADTFNYLADKLENDPNNKAAQIYRGYADDLQRQADDLAKNGLTMTNRRALSELRKRYSGEIGQLVRADERMQEVRKKRDALQAAGKQMLYGVDNLDINDFLGDGSQFNGYAIDAEDLRKEAAAYAQNVSSGIYDSDLVPSTNKYFLEQVKRYGYTPEIMSAWRNNLESIPEFNRAVDDIIKARGIDTNLKGINYEQARQTIINGIMEGAVSKTVSDFTSNPDVLTRDQELDNARMQRSLMFQEEKSGLKWNPDTKSYERDDPNEWMYTHEDESKPNTSRRTGLSVAGEEYYKKKTGKTANGRGGGGSTNRYTQIPKPVRVTWDDDPKAKDATYKTKELDSSASSETAHEGKVVTYDELPQYAKDRVDAIIGPNGDVDLHMYYFKPFTSGKLNDTEAVLDVVPYDVSVFNNEEDIDIENDSDLENGN